MLARLLVPVVVLTTACSGAGVPPPDDPPDAGDRRELPADVLSRPAICYSGYRTGQSPDIQRYPSEEEIEADLRLLVRGGWRWIRLFDAGPHAERVLSVIDRTGLDVVVLLGAWIAGDRAGHDAANREQIDRAVALATAHPDHVVALSVGNETLDDWSNVRLPPAELAAYLADARARVAVPVTTDDSWLPFIFGRDGATDYADVVQVAAAVDFLSIHVYAFADAGYESWDWKQESVPEAARAAAMMDAALGYSRSSVAQVRAALAAHDLSRQIVIGEIGWKSATSATEADPPEKRVERFLAHPVNQKMFRDRLDAWLGESGGADHPDAGFWFEGFDEPWKAEWGDDGWGFLDVDRRPKFVVRETYPDLVPPDAPAYTDADAVYYRSGP